MQLGPVSPTVAVMNLRVADWFEGRSSIIETARALLSQPPTEGRLRIVVAHGNVARNAIRVYPGEGEALVIRSLGAEGFEVIGRIAPSDWDKF